MPTTYSELERKYRAALARIRELEDDRDSWAEQASQRVADWQREHDLRVAAERRVGELERASQTGSGEAVAKIVGVDEYGPQIEWSRHWVEINGCTLYVQDEK